MIRLVTLRCFVSESETLHEEVVLPPAIVECNTANVLGMTLMKGLSTYLFGSQTFRSWLHLGAAAVFGSICFFFSCDSATANVLLVTIVGVGLQVIGLAQGVFVYWWCEPCALHQLGRVMISLLHIASLSAAMYATTRALQSKRNKTRIEKSLWELAKKLDWKPGEDPPRSYARD
jgi:hypothetical protein